MAFAYPQIQKILEVHTAKGKRERQEWDKWHAWYLSEAPESPPMYANPRVVGTVEDSPATDLELETNYPYAFIDTMIANICPTNPMVTVTARAKENGDSAKAREAIINDTLRRSKMHAKAWDISTYGSMCGRGFSKTTWDTKKKCPMVRVINPRNIFYDMSVDWDDARYVIEAIPMTKSEFDERVSSGQYDKEAAEEAVAAQMPDWLLDKNTFSSFLNEGSRAVFEWVIVYEFYDLTANRVYHMLDHSEKPLFEGSLPYKFMRSPYSMIVFNKNLMDNSGVSDVKLIARVQERLNELDSLELWFAHVSIPIMLVNTNAIDNIEEAMTTVQNATGPGAIARLAVNQAMPIEAAIGYTRTPTMSPSFDKMRERCTSLIEFILGIPQYARGVIGGAEVATEVALTDTATRTRNARRIKVIEDWVIDVSMKCLALWREFFPKDRAVQLRGRTPNENVDVDRLSLAFPEDIDPQSPEAPEQMEDDWYYDYETVPYSPTENHKLVQLQKLQQFIEIMLQNPAIDPVALMYKLTELLGIEEVRRDPSQAQAAMQQPVPGQPPQPSQQQSGTSADTIATGGLPPDQAQQMEAILPPGARAMAQQPAAG